MKLGINIEERLSTSLGNNQGIPNVMLAEEITREEDVQSVVELARLLSEGSRDQKKSAIKVLYEIGDRQPALIADHIDVFLTQMTGLDIRLVWGSLMALSSISCVTPKPVFKCIKDICSAGDKGSIIAKDQVFKILLNLMKAEPRLIADLMPVLIDRLEISSIHQFPRYAENALATLPVRYEPLFRELLQRRLSEVKEQSRISKIEILLKKYK